MLRPDICKNSFYVIVIRGTVTVKPENNNRNSKLENNALFEYIGMGIQFDYK